MYHLQCLLTTGMVLLCLKKYKADTFEGPNIALNQTASQLPGIVGGGDAHYAVDGILANDFNSGNKCAHTDFSDTVANWTVTLDRAYNITGIKLLNRKSETWRIRLKNFNVLGNGKELYSNNETTNSCKDYSGTRPNPSVCDETIIIPVHNEEKVINITILVNSHKNYSNYPNRYPFQGDDKRAILCVCEVQIFAIVCLLPNITNGKITPAMPYTTPNSTIRFTCNKGYRMDSDTSTCTDSGVWSPLPTCNLVHCFVPGDIVNGNYRDQTQTNLEVNHSLPYQSSIHVSCNVGFETKHESSPRQCLADGTWNGSSPSCDPVQCSYPDEVPNGFYVDINSGKTYTSESLPYLSNITAQCNEGYELSSVIRTCLDNKTWSGLTPRCELVYCSPPSELESGYYVIHGNETIYHGNVSLAYGTKLKAMCYQGYRLRSGSSEITCNTDHEWTKPYPRCDMVSCFVPITKSGVQRKFSVLCVGETVPLNATVNETCAENYRSVVFQVVRRCTETGEFNGSEIVCENVNPTTSTLIGAAVGGTAGAFVVIIVALVIVIVLQRRRILKAENKNTNGDYENVIPSTEGNEYLEIRVSRIS